ncbi:MAG: gliding motility-associated C-terminal domain-containing protein [Bacteroidetes bacterium]|nr:gliding motility-associated C-terminal domain-containing protein [Bacteroidota bacterium]
MHKSLLAFVLAVCVSSVALAQGGFWSNAGALVSIRDTSFVSVIGDMYNSNGGIYYNFDSIFLTGDWSNTAGNHAFDSILVPAGTGYVYMYAADQRIKGTDQTYFHNLILKNQGTKYADLDAKVDGFLDMTDREFSVDTNTIWVRNPRLNSVRRTTGFLSSLKDGGLLRYTDSDSTYLYPVGSNLGTFRYRPIEMTPTASQNNQYKVRFANIDPTAEGFDRNIRFHLVCSINPNWYHRIYHPYGPDSADLAIFYDPAADGQWNDIVHWQNVPEWESIHRDTVVPGSPFTKMAKFRWNDYSYSPFALAITSQPFAVAGVDTIIWRLDTIQLQASGGVGYAWSPADSLSDASVSDPLAWPSQSTIYHLTVEDSKGCYDYDSLYVLVRNKPIPNFFIPDVITPNGDGYNDFWHIRDLDRYPQNEVRIINRWGDELFYEAPYQQDWTGMWKGEPLPGATYYYILKVKDENGNWITFNGPITVVR